MSSGAYDRATIDLIKRQIEAMLANYERATAEYAAFMAEWRRRLAAREAAE